MRSRDRGVQSKYVVVSGKISIVSGTVQSQDGLFADGILATLENPKNG